MPTGIDEKQMGKQETLDLSRPQGTPHGLPVKQIPHQEYPRCVYKHPVSPFREVFHRNVNHEVVHREVVATEHKIYICQSEAEFKKKLAEGYITKPYIPEAPPDPDDVIYRASEKETMAPRAANK